VQASGQPIVIEPHDAIRVLRSYDYVLVTTELACDMLRLVTEDFTHKPCVHVLTPEQRPLSVLLSAQDRLQFVV
jgi:hypothetical protein